MSSNAGYLLSPLVLIVLVMGLVGCSTTSQESTDSDDALTEQTGPPEHLFISEETEQQLQQQNLPFYATGPVARIDDEYIGPDRFNDMVRERTDQLPGGLPPQMVEMFKQQSVDFVIDKFLVDRVLDGQDIQVTDEDLQEAFQEFRERLGDEADFQRQLEQLGTSEEELMDSMEADVKLEKYLATRYDLEVTEEEIRGHFEDHRARYGQRELAGARHILIELDRDAGDEQQSVALERAQSIYEQAIDGADFAELAREYSEGPTASQGGDLGMFEENRMVAEFAEVVFGELEVDEISEPVRTDFGYHIILKTDHQPAAEAELGDVRDDIETQLVHQRRQEVFHNFLEELKAEADIEELTDNIEVTVDVPEEPAQDQPLPPGSGGDQPVLDPVD